MKAGKLMRSQFAIIPITIIVVVVVFSAFNILLPPADVVESGSMQHSENWTQSAINTGDIIFQKNVTDPIAQITTYVQGRATNFSTYGDYGNVVMYVSPENFSIVHRAMFYLEWNGTRPVIIGYDNQSWLSISRQAVIIKDVGYSHRNLVVYLNTMVGVSGFITMGDNNLGESDTFDNYTTAYVAADQNIFGYLPVNVSQVTGFAWGIIPWVGLIKLNILKEQGQWSYSDQVPRYSYVYLFISTGVVITLLAISAYYLENLMGRNKPGKSS